MTSAWTGGSAAAEADDDVFSMNGASVNPDEIRGGEVLDKPGWYHFEITNVVRKLDLQHNGKPANPHVLVHMTVIAAAKGDESQLGRKFYQRIILGKQPEGGGPLGPPSEWDVKRAMTFGLGLGVIATATNADGQPICVDAQNKSPKIGLGTWDRLVGRQCVCKVQFQTDKKGNLTKYLEIPFGKVYHPLDPLVAEAPREQSALSLIVGIQPWTSPPPDGEFNGEVESPKMPASKAGPDIDDI